MKIVEAIVKTHHLELVYRKLCAQGVEGMTVSDVREYGLVYHPTSAPGFDSEPVSMMPRVKVEVLIPEELEHVVIEALVDATWKDSIGDTPISVIPVEDIVRVRTGERGEAAL